MSQKAFSLLLGYPYAREATFTGDAVLKSTLSSTFSGDAVLKATIAGTFTGDAYLLVIVAGSFTGNAVLLAPISDNYTADAVLLGTIAGTFSGDSVLLATISGTYTADAILLRTEPVTYTGDAYLLVVVDGSLTADSVLLATLSDVFSGDSVLYGTVSATFTGDAVLSKTESATFTGDSVLKATLASTFTADAVLAATIAGTFTGDAVLGSAVSVSYAPPFQPDAFQLDAFDTDLSFNANAVLLKTASATFTGDSFITELRTGSFTADAIFSGVFTGNAVFKKEITGASKTANAVLKRTQSGSFSGKAWLGTAPTPALIFSDDFNNRVTYNEPGAPSGGGHYKNGNVNHGYVVSGTVQVQAGDQDYAEAEFHLGPATSDAEVYFDFKTVSGSYYFFAASPRKDDVGPYFAIPYFDVYDDGGGNWVVSSGFGPVSLTLSGSTWYRAHARLDGEGRRDQVRIWDRSLAEPGVWNLDAVNNADFTFDTYFHSQFYVGWLDDDNATEPAQFDNLLVYQIGGTISDFLLADAILLRTSAAQAFTADAVIFDGTVERTFTGDAWIDFDSTTVSFTGNAVVKKTASGTFTGNSRLVKTLGDDFTADAWFKTVPENIFYARAIIHRPTNQQRLKKRVDLHILDHRPRPLPVYLPPRIPDEKEVPQDGLGGAPCLPPCPGSGAGFGTGYGVNGGAIVQTITHCTTGSCTETYYNTGDGWLGKGSLTVSSAHCPCDSSHSETAHVNRMWITYTTIPTSPFRMRAKMIWDVGSPPQAIVNVYANASAPTTELGECDPTGAYWDNGNLIGRMSFSADGNGSIAGRDVWFQTEATGLGIDPNAISTNTFRFQLDDEGQFYHAEFKASTSEIVID